jgi:CDP-paratose 2-epimerase
MSPTDPLIPDVSSRAPVQSLDVEKPILVTGGAGFIGCNLADRLLTLGHEVIVLDDLSRPRVNENLAWLTERHRGKLRAEIGDVRDAAVVRRAVAEAGGIYHLAAQVAVTTSLDDPWRDFEINLRGTLNVLEALRGSANPPFVVYTSTNKVYGGLVDLAVAESGGRCQPLDAATRSRGISELRRLDFHSPYGCSKGAADQYVLDYARSYGIPGVVFRMSCIYGPRQFGTEDQGWVAHFLLRALAREPITIYGDGRQVRDLLFVDDLVEAFLLAGANARRLAGQPFNIGGGSANAVSLLDVLGKVSELTGYAPELTYSPWRLGDQRYYVSDTRAFRNATGWSPRTDVPTGLDRLHASLVQLAHERRTGEQAAV